MMAPNLPLAAVPDAQDTIRRLESRLAREKSGRQQAESLLEEKSLALFTANQALRETALELEQRVRDRTLALEEALNRAQSANEAKSRFLALMSHEIRTPMNGVLGLSELLLATPLQAQQADYANNIFTAGSALLSLINDLLDFSKIEAGEVVIEILPVDPLKLLNEAAELLQFQADSRGITLQVTHADGLPALIQTDPTRLRQVWINLLSNALKFTHVGSVTAHLALAADRLVCSVQDTGIGIAPAALANLFEPFRQADNTMTRRYGGTGLGLVICKSLIEHMGGSLTVKSTPGQGTTFSFDLAVPAASVAANPGAAAAITPAASDPVLTEQEALALAALRILLVDDYKINRLVARNQLAKIGCAPLFEAENGEQALHHLRQENFDVVLMDVQMPGMDGLEATRQLRQLPLRPQPVVIAMTANAFAQDREDCLAAGMDQFLTKPVAPRVLRTALVLALRGRVGSEPSGH